jgi:hypothetical protein
MRTNGRTPAATASISRSHSNHEESLKKSFGAKRELSGVNGTFHRADRLPI